MSLEYAAHQEKISKIFETLNFLPTFDAGSRLLDFGCGVGALTRDIASKFPESTITGIDINKFLIDLAITRAQEQGLKNIQFVQSDVNSDLNLGKDYDGVYCRFLLEDLGEPVQVIKAMTQFVKDGGWVCAYERLNNFSKVYPYSEAIEITWNGIYEFFKTRYGANPRVAERLNDHFAAAGLKNITIQGFSRVLSRHTQGELFGWYLDAACSVIKKLKEQLVLQKFVSEEVLNTAVDDYKRLLEAPTSFVLEVTACVSGIK